MGEIKINHAAVVIPLTRDQRVLLQRKDLGYPWNPGMWCFFGGKIEDEELANGEQTLYRELREEIGLELEDLKYFGDRPYFDIAPANGRRREGNLHAYVAQFDGDLSKLKLREGAGMSLWEQSEIWPLHMVPHNKDILLEVYRSLPK